MARSKRFKPNKNLPRNSMERLLMAPVPPDSEMNIENPQQPENLLTQLKRKYFMIFLINYSINMV